jgi:hypothetical protein
MTSLDLHLALQAKLASSSNAVALIEPNEQEVTADSMTNILDPECWELRRKFHNAMHERVNSEGALYDFGALARWSRFDKAKLEWETAVDLMFEHRRTCRDCPRGVARLE